MKTLKSNWAIIVSMSLAILITIIISLVMGLNFNSSGDALKIEFILIFAIIFIMFPVFFICLFIDDKLNK